MSSILKDERILLRKINRSRLDAGYKVSTFFSFSTNFFPPPTHSQVDRCRDVKLIFAGKGVGETLNILVHRRSMGGRERRRFIIRRDRMEKRILCHRFLSHIASRERGPRGSIHPSRGTNHLPTRRPNRYSLLEKETFRLSRCRRFLNVSAAAPRTFDSNLAVFDQRPTD